MPSRLSVCQGVADPGDDAIPLMFLVGRIIDQHTVDEATYKVASVVPSFSRTNVGHGKESRCNPFVGNLPRRIFTSQISAGEDPSVLMIDLTVKSARRSGVVKRAPYPVFGLPASSENIEVGTSTEAPDSGILNRIHSGWAATITGQKIKLKAMK
jgi:hypothetical protein